MDRMRRIIRQLIEDKGFKDKIEPRMAIIRWKDVVDPIIYRFSRAVRMEDGVLTVIVTNSTVLAEMRFRKEEILRRYRELMGEGVVRDIQFKLGVLKAPQKAEGGEEEYPLRGDISGVELTPEEMERVERAVSVLRDEELRERFKRAFIGLIKLRKWRRARGG